MTCNPHTSADNRLRAAALVLRWMGIHLPALPAGAAGGKADPGDATWHIGLVELWGKDAKGQGRQLDIYPVFEQGRWARAVATARRFNTSIHLVERADVTLAPPKVTGRLSILLTPDRWVPADGQPISLLVEIDGTLKPGEGDAAFSLTGTYKGTLGGQDVSGALTGGVGATEPDWGDSRWTALLNPVAPPGGPDREMIQVVLGVADGKVNWGRAGITWRGGPHREHFFDTSGLTLDGGTVTGTFTLPGRVVNVACDPKAVCEVQLTAYRVQGLNGGKARFAMTLDGKPLGEPFMAYGRGSAAKGGGKADPDAGKALWHYDLDAAPWWVPTAGFQPPAPGEHPRLFFRKADVPALRRKAQTPDGKAIVERLRLLLGGGGESLPTTFNTTPPHNHDQSPKLPVGTFTTWHCVGYGMLHVLTGEAKYAELSRRAVQLCFDGRIDRDNRYGWATPGTTFRAGPVLAGIGLAYDFCYDAWPDDFRRKVALSIQDYARQAHETGGGKVVTLELLAGRTGYPPGSNHYGAHVAAGTGVLAILGDPGTDTPRLRERLAEFETDLVRSLCHGFGDGGWYAEGHHPSRVSANLGILPFMMALRTAAGRDYVAARANVQWITLRWIMELLPGKGRASFPRRGVYGTDDFDMAGMSHDGEFAYGFGCVDEKLRPALLWVYRNFVEPSHPTWGAATYPHRAVASFVNWPAGVEPVNPGKLMPKVVADTIHGYIACRNRWKDADDVVVTHLLDLGPEGYYRVKDAGTIYLWGLGLRAHWKTALGGATPTHFKPEADGSYVLSALAKGKCCSLAVDLSGKSGAAAMLVGTGEAFSAKGFRPPKPAGDATIVAHEVQAAGRTFVVVTLQNGDPPKLEPAGDAAAIKVGAQTIRYDGTNLVLGP